MGGIQRTEMGIQNSLVDIQQYINFHFENITVKRLFDENFEHALGFYQEEKLLYKFVYIRYGISQNCMYFTDKKNRKLEQDAMLTIHQKLKAILN